MPLQIIGAGFGRTGTVSTKAALEILGFGPCYHMREILQHRPGVNDGHLDAWSEHARGQREMDWDFIFQNYNACLDHPTCHAYEELMERYPDAKVILNVRDGAGWFRSFEELMNGLVGMRKLGRFVPRVRKAFDIVDILVKQNVMGGVVERDANIEVFERHNAEVIAKVPADRLLVFNVKEGWEPLCAFLGVDVPDMPFPHLNESKGSTAMRVFRYWLETNSPAVKAGWAVGGAAAVAAAALLFVR